MNQPPRPEGAYIISLERFMTDHYGFYLVLQGEGAVGDVGGQIRVVDGAEGQAVGPAAAEVRDVDILKGAKRGRRRRRCKNHVHN